MCEFFSSLLTKNGDLLYDLDFDSHEELIEKFKVKDSQTAFYAQHFVRLEFTPDLAKDISKPEGWTLRLDENSKPDWYDPDKAQEKCWDVISSLFVKGRGKKLGKGHFILLGATIVDEAVDSTIHYMLGKSKVRKLAGKSKVGGMCDFSEVGEMRDSSEVWEIWDRSEIERMYDSSKVGEMCDSSKVGEMWNHSEIERMHDSSKVGVMFGSSKVGGMRDSSEVGEMHDFSKVGVVYDSSEVGVMYDFSKVEKDLR